MRIFSSEEHCNTYLFSSAAGLLADDIDVFDFAPGEHTATIRVNDTFGNSDSESITFTTPLVGEYNSLPNVKTYCHH